MTDKTEVYEDKAGGWRWRRLAPNGQIIATAGEAYTRHADAEHAALRVFGPEPTEDEDEGKGRDG